ncbi:cation transporter [Clostridium sp. MSJ-11]|uniref:Copper chaperone CopZ n=1 Tax=Clostridium mobile TaxID=2841512 RepID=A0ABS6EHV2_9CLOT|nr:cation transporter [Clostridium mobile]
MRIKKTTIKVFDMTCSSCEQKIKKEIQKLPGLIWIRINFAKSLVEVQYDSQLCSEKKLIESIEKCGYSTKRNNFSSIIGILIVVLIIFFLVIFLGLVKEPKNNINISKPIMENGVQVIKMNADYSGYSPNAFYVQKNIPVKLIIDGKNLNYCNNEIVFSSINVERKLESRENIVEFTPANGDINFSCWMGMIRGYIKVVDDINDTSDLKASDIIPNDVDL